MSTASPNSSKTCGPTGQRILQLHPSLRCNLCCEHCYSSSGPGVRTELDPAMVCGLVSDAARMGYQVVSFSGGEPFLYSGLLEVLRHAKSLGLRTTVTTNGYFLQPRRLESLRDLVDVLAVSLDGPPELHNRLRGTPQAFDRLCAALKNLRASRMNFGFIHTLTHQTWEHLLWIAEFAAESGARLLQLHPLEMAGRGEGLGELCAEEDGLAKAYVVAAALAAKYSGSMTVQVDLLHREQVLRFPQIVYADELSGDWSAIAPADLLGLIVIEADGTVVPISYGFSRRYQICSLKEQKLDQGWQSFLNKGYPEFRRLCRELFEELVAPTQRPLFNWHERVVARSHLFASTPVAAHLSAA
jgi:MoaA/NifB/PqqE/SkfB family radical SAM enzyme